MLESVTVVMDDIARINIKKDTTFALMLEAQRRDCRLYYLNEGDLSLTGGECRARRRPVTVREDPADYFSLGPAEECSLGEGDMVLMRADPPVDAGYLHATFLLEQAERNGARVVNRPRALRDFNEKLAIARFPELIPATRVSAVADQLREFVVELGRAVIKPLDGMGGSGVFIADAADPNLNVIIETVTDSGRSLAMVQEWLPEIVDGDKRLLMIDGTPVPHVLARIPGGNDFRGNLARGGTGRGQAITDAERAIAAAVGPVLKDNGIVFAGLDVIGDRLTEINVTSPTCVRELDAWFDVNIAGDLFDALE